MNSDKILFQSNRLYIRQAEPNNKDIKILVKLHNNPLVMKYVGFPKGLNSTIKKETISTEKTLNTDDARLLVFLKDNPDTCIGSCKIGTPDEEGYCNIDYKLFSEFWGKGYGKELIKELARYIFEVKNYNKIKITPNKLNIASQKIFESIGGIRVGENYYKMPEDKKKSLGATDVDSHIYTLNKKDFK